MIPHPKKTNQELFQEEWLRLHGCEWLFPQNFDVKEGEREVSGPTNSEEYIEAFRKKQRLLMLRCPAPYKWGVLEKYKSRVALSAHITNGAAVVPYTILQLEGGTTHAIADWVWDEEESRFMFPVTMFLSDQREYARFIEANRGYECAMKEERLGFGASQ